MLFCSRCRKPVEACECTEEYKENWKKSIARRIDERIEESERVIYCVNARRDLRERVQERLEGLSYADNSCEMDETIWKALDLLEQKGYDLGKNFFRLADGYDWQECRPYRYGQKDRDYIEIQFTQPYWFDFTEFPSKKGWTYDHRSHTLRFSFSGISVKVLEKSGKTVEEYLEAQKAVLLTWAESLPKARLLEDGEAEEGLVRTGALRQNRRSGE